MDVLHVSAHGGVLRAGGSDVYPAVSEGHAGNPSGGAAEGNTRGFDGPAKGGYGCDPGGSGSLDDGGCA